MESTWLAFPNWATLCSWNSTLKCIRIHNKNNNTFCVFSQVVLTDSEKDGKESGQSPSSAMDKLGRKLRQFFKKYFFEGQKLSGTQVKKKEYRNT